MSKILLWTVFLGGFLMLNGDKPRDAILPSDSIKPTVKLSLLTSVHPQEGDDIQLECSAKPKDKTNASKPDSVHWIKGNVGVPEPGIRPEAERFIRETHEGDGGVVLFHLTIKDAEATDTDKYMCIVQVGNTGYFTSNEIKIDIAPGEKKKEEPLDLNDEKQLQDILKWKDRIEELSQDELNILADALRKEKQMNEEKQKKQEVKTNENVNEKQTASKTKPKENLQSLTEEEKNLLKRKDAIDDMAEEELMLLVKAMKKEKAIKKREEEEREREKKKQEEEEKERAKKKQKEEEEERAKREMEKNTNEEESLTLTPEEKAILKRKNDIPDLTDDEIKLLSQAMKKERKIQIQEDLVRQKEKEKKEKEQKEKEKKEKEKKEQEKKVKVTEDSEDELTEEEREILKRRDEIRSMSQDELKVMAKAVTKQKKKEDEKKKSSNADNAEKSQIKDDEQLTVEELQILMRKDDVMEMDEDELKLLAGAMKKQNKLEQKYKDPTTGFDEEMTEEAMNALLKKKDNFMDLSQNELNLFSRALIKEKQLKQQRKQEERERPDESEMTEDEMRDILKWQHGDLTKLTQNQLSLLGKALLKEKEMKDKTKRANDPLEDEEIYLNMLKDEL